MFSSPSSLVAALVALSTLSFGNLCFADASPEEVVQPAAATSFTGKVTGSNVRMRLSADLGAPVVELLDEGSYLMVVGEKEDFYAVAPVAGAKAYIYRPYVLDGKVEGSHVNIRLEPDVDAAVVTQLNTGDEVNGEVCATNPRWMEIAMPTSVQFFVAKEYLENVGGPELLTQRQERQQAVNALLQEAYLASQAQLNKPAVEMNLAEIEAQFARVGAEYPDFPEYVARAEAVCQVVRQLFAERQVTVGQELGHEAVVMQEVSLEDLTSLAFGPTKEKAAREIPLQIAGQTDEFADPLSLVTPAVERHFVTDKMLAWEPVEESLFEVWAMQQDDSSREQFYDEQRLDGVVMTGIIEPYDRPVRNRPGDFLLVKNSRPVAFLYSTRINLEEKVGQEVTIRGLARPNHHFAFPAYFVLALEN